MTTFQNYKDEFGTVRFEGKEYALTQNAYIDTDFSLNWNPSIYTAHAIDEEENDYKVKWEIINHESNDESDACDWTDCTVEEA